MFSMKTWDEEANDETTLRFASEIAKKFFARVDPLHPCISSLNRGDFRDVLDFRPPFTDGPEAYRNHAAAVGLVKKLPCLPLGSDPKLSAIVKFLSGESECRETNYLFNLWKRGEFQFRPVVERILHSTQRKIQDIVGSVPDIESVRFRFSPGGASTKTKKHRSDIRSLMAEIGFCSEELIGTELLGSILATTPGLSSFLTDDGESTGSFLMEIHRSRLDFVRKDASTDRIITVEPPMNKFVQNGYGDYLRQCCKRSGIDLSDQTRNQELARIGSITDGLATVDLSNASGLMALGLIEHLWSPEWFDLLMTIRSGYTTYGNTTFHMQSYAGMGNGTTFPVESITFFCLATSVCEELHLIGPVSAYGDDIIIPVSAYPLLCSVFNALGFSINLDKSFASGPFRESCGSDWYSGYLVRPAFLRGNISYRRLYLLHNHYYRLGDFEAANWFLDFIPPPHRIFGPDGYGDGHLLGRWDGKVYYHKVTSLVLRQNCICKHLGVPHGSECYKKVTLREKTSQYTFETYGDRVSHNFMRSKVDWLLPAYSVYMSSPSSASEVFGMIHHTRFKISGTDILHTITPGGASMRIITPQYIRQLARSFRYTMDEIKDRRGGSKLPPRPRWFDMPPDSSIWVKGTPMPGSRGVSRVRVCVFDHPSGSVLA